jgi:nucleotide-binding universal stress UspA family protein
MKKILVPTDFSECASAAAEVAIALAQKAHAEIYFLHISPDTTERPHVPVGIEHPKQEVNRDAVQSRNELSMLVARAEKMGLKATPVLVFDKGSEEIENYIEPFKIDLIVMGSHGVKGIREYVLGSNTQRVIRHVKIPVLVIKEKPASMDFKNIIFASTFQEDVKHAFKEVAAFAMLLNSQVHLVYINFIDHLVEPAEAEAKMNALALNYPYIQCSNNMAETNDEEWAIHQFTSEVQADLISITTHDKVGLFSFLSQSVAEELVNHEHTPVLVLGKS